MNMSHTIPFDTLHNYERLIKVGFNEAQAKEQTAIIAELVNEKLATKRDLNILWLKMTITMGSITVVVGGLIVALIEYLK